MPCILCIYWLTLYLWRFNGRKINYNYNYNYIHKGRIYGRIQWKVDNFVIWQLWQKRQF